MINYLKVIDNIANQHRYDKNNQMVTANINLILILIYCFKIVVGLYAIKHVILASIAIVVRIIQRRNRKHYPWRKQQKRYGKKNSIHKKQQRRRKNSNVSGKGLSSRLNSTTNTATIKTRTRPTDSKGSGSKSREGSVRFHNMDENIAEIENKVEKKIMMVI